MIMSRRGPRSLSRSVRFQTFQRYSNKRQVKSKMGFPVGKLSPIRRILSQCPLPHPGIKYRWLKSRHKGVLCTRIDMSGHYTPGSCQTHFSNMAPGGGHLGLSLKNDLLQFGQGNPQYLGIHSMWEKKVQMKALLPQKLHSPGQKITVSWRGRQRSFCHTTSAEISAHFAGLPRHEPEG